jgi:TfoX/Sxy family transcriptional regulator of competence genes
VSMPAAIDRMHRDLEDAAAHLGKSHDLRFKAMFGGLMAYLDERPCAWISLDGLALKLLPVDQLALLQIDGSRRMQARPGKPPSRHYIVVPAALCHDTPQLAGWLARSADTRVDRP